MSDDDGPVKTPGASRSPSPPPSAFRRRPNGGDDSSNNGKAPRVKRESDDDGVLPGTHDAPDDSEAETVVLSAEGQTDDAMEGVTKGDGDRADAKRTREREHSSPVRSHTRKSSTLKQQQDRNNKKNDNDTKEASNGVEGKKRGVKLSPNNAAEDEKKQRERGVSSDGALSSTYSPSGADFSDIEKESVPTSPATRKRKRRDDGDTASEPPRQKQRSNDRDGSDMRSSAERSQSPKLRGGHRRAASSITAQGAQTTGTKRKKVPAPLQTARDAKSTRSYDSESSDEGGHPSAHGPSKRLSSRSVSTPGRAMMATHKKKDRYGLTILAKACESGDVDKARQALDADPEELEITDNDGNTPLQIAALKGHDEIVAFLLSKGCRTNTANTQRQDTPLIDAVENGHVAVIRLLLDAGMDPTRANRYGKQPIDLIQEDDEDGDEIRTMLRNATAKSSSKTAKRAAPGGNASNSKSSGSRDEASTAKPRKDLDFIERTTKNLRALAEKNDFFGVGEFMKAFVRVDTQCLVAAAQGGHLDVLNLLLAGAEPKKIDYEAPLLAAIGRGHIDTLDLLLKQDIDPTRKTRDGQYYWQVAEERQGPRWETERDMLREAFDKRRGNKTLKNVSQSGETSRSSPKSSLKRTSDQGTHSQPSERSPKTSRRASDAGGRHSPTDTKARRKLVSGRDMKDSSTTPASTTTRKRRVVEDDEDDEEQPNRHKSSPGPTRSSKVKAERNTSEPRAVKVEDADHHHAPSSRRDVSHRAKRDQDDKEKEKETTREREREKKAKHDKEKEKEKEKERAAAAKRKKEEEEERERERKAKAEADRKAKEEADRKAKEEAERKAKEEAERQARLKAEREAREAAERAARAKAEAEAARKRAEEEAAAAAARRRDYLSRLPSGVAYMLQQGTEFPLEIDPWCAGAEYHCTPVELVRGSEICNDSPLVGSPPTINGNGHVAGDVNAPNRLWMLNIQAAGILGWTNLEGDSDTAGAAHWPKRRVTNPQRHTWLPTHVVAQLTHSDTMRPCGIDPREIAQMNGTSENGGSTVKPEPPTPSAIAAMKATHHQLLRDDRARFLGMENLYWVPFDLFIRALQDERNAPRLANFEWEVRADYHFNLVPDPAPGREGQLIRPEMLEIRKQGSLASPSPAPGGGATPASPANGAGKMRAFHRLQVLERLDDAVLRLNDQPVVGGWKGGKFTTAPH